MRGFSVGIKSNFLIKFSNVGQFGDARLWPIIQMKIRTNKIMERTLGQRGHDFIKQTVTLPTELEKLVDSGFRIEEELHFIKRL
jgi:hypothetical protein